MAEAMGGQLNLVDVVNDEGSTQANFGNFTLYVGDLDWSVNEGQLYDLFSQVAPVITVKVCRDLTKINALGYGYVNFASADHATNAMELLNYTLINGRPMRIMHCHRDPSLRKSGKANLFIKNLDTSVDNKSLHDTFATFGTVLSCKVEVDDQGQSKGYGYVQFEDEDRAQEAITKLNGMLLNEKQVYVGFHLRRHERNTDGPQKYTNVFVKNLSERFTDEDLRITFSPFGTITSAVVMKDESGKSRCFGFVNFQSTDSAASAVDNLNATTHDDKVWFVGRAQKKAEREAELKAKFEQERINRYERIQASNLYLKNIDDNVDEEKLKELFSEFGTVTSCKIVLGPHGVRRGFAFVSLSTPEEATNAIKEMNAKMVGTKPLFVAVAQRKEERKAKLQAQFAQGMLIPPPVMPPFHHVPFRLPPHPFYFGQGGPGMLPPQPAIFGLPNHHIFPGMHPRLAPNFMLPYHLQRQGLPPQRFGARRFPSQFPPQQFTNRNGGQNLRYSGNGRNVVDPVMPLMPLGTSGVPTASNDIGAAAGSMSSASLASALAAASPEDQQLILKQKLYPLVDGLEHDHASKVTGMLLEMDQTEVLHLVESPDALKEKVDAAMTVLRSAAVASDADE